MLAIAAFVLQALVSLPPSWLRQGYLQHNMLLWAVLISGPVDWTKGGFNWGWLYTVPVTLGICRPWFRSRVGG